MSKKRLRESMPEVAAWVDSLRAAFGKEMVDEQIRQGMRGEPTFWASQNGHEVGTRIERGDGIGWNPVTGCAMELEKK